MLTLGISVLGYHSLASEPPRARDQANGVSPRSGGGAFVPGSGAQTGSGTGSRSNAIQPDWSAQGGTPGPAIASGQAPGSLNALSQLPAINLRYSVIRQPLPKTLQELFSLAGVNFVLESELTDTITNGSFAGSLTEILNDLGRRHNFVWTYGNGVVEIVHVKQVVSRTLKLGGGIDQARIAAILRASDIDPDTPLVRYEPEASLLRVRGSARFVARVEAALNLAVSKEESVNVIRYGRTFKVIDQ